VLAGWAVAAGGLLLWVWRISWPRDSHGTKRLAEEEGQTRVTDTVRAGNAQLSQRGSALAGRVRRGSTNDRETL